MWHSDTNLQEPFLGPTLPTYPALDELVMVTGALSGGVYPATTQQFTPPLGTRSREACYVYEPNGVALKTNMIYECRLVGNSGGLPLYVTVCCQ